MDDCIEAEILIDFTLFPDVKGARRSMGTAAYRPNHQFRNYTSTFIGFIDFENGICEPGDTVRAQVHSLFEPGMKHLLVIGNSWDVKEGSKLVGKAMIKEVDFRDS
ncbi:hypothetical protein ACFSJ3_18005 [Corallincola platygyrae]|uniref:Translation elongation factor EFTu/EF1A C-terminal domain-containing protein n=1 Tax=Corallincola platygyrae TaxID=1193278 RepID=A0ABW4XSR5_9GAMM